jgi:hypothetical protein
MGNLSSHFSVTGVLDVRAYYLDFFCTTQNLYKTRAFISASLLALDRRAQLRLLLCLALLGRQIPNAESVERNLVA